MSKVKLWTVDTDSWGRFHFKTKEQALYFKEGYEYCQSNHSISNKEFTIYEEEFDDVKDKQYIHLIELKQHKE